jgi:hypothetical protein
MRRFFYTALLLLCCLNGAMADVRIEASPGGKALNFIAFFEVLRQSGQRIVVDGPCLSACTLVLSTIPRDRICVTKRAIFGFHSAKIIDQYGNQHPAEVIEANRVVLASYPAPIQDWIRQHGGLTARLILLHGKALTAMYPVCR